MQFKCCLGVAEQLNDDVFVGFIFLIFERHLNRTKRFVFQERCGIDKRSTSASAPCCGRSPRTTSSPGLLSRQCCWCGRTGLSKKLFDSCRSLSRRNASPGSGITTFHSFTRAPSGQRCLPGCAKVNSLRDLEKFQVGTGQGETIDHIV